MSPSNGQANVCFVVMPFGTKALNDGSGRTFDFDKVYRVLIQRAVRLAGLTPLRTDEQVGSQVIHLDMFKSLRDTAIVLADLSTTNANVFYELGIRHVMSASGTVLMCREGTELPFDIKLSRVVFYRYDGQSLDWEEVERVVTELKTALEEAQGRRPDSPVHALLEGVLAGQPSDSTGMLVGKSSSCNGELRFDDYQKLVAEHWRLSGQELAGLRQRYGQCSFGARAVAYYCLAQDPFPSEAKDLVRDLYDCEQYDLVNELFERMIATRELSIRELLCYGSSLSEANLTEVGAAHALRYTEKALATAKSRLTAADASAADYEAAFHCCCNVSGLRFWTWQLNQHPAGLQQAIESMNEALTFQGPAMAKNENFALGRLAQAHLKLLLMLRLSERNPDRNDAEGHSNAILKIDAAPNTAPRIVSYLRWYQAIVWADMGNEKNAYELTIRQVRDDAKIMNLADCSEIGRRQYSHLRRFLEHNSSILRNPTLIGRIAHALQTSR